MDENLYELLEVEPEATKYEINEAYRDLTYKNNPDNLNIEKKYEDFYRDKLKKISIATEVLLDDIKREEYDKTLGINIDEIKKLRQEKYDLQFKENILLVLKIGIIVFLCSRPFMIVAKNIREIAYFYLVGALVIVPIINTFYLSNLLKNKMENRLILNRIAILQIIYYLELLIVTYITLKVGQIIF